MGRVETNFKQTEVGLVPMDWEVKKLGEVAEVERGASPRPIEDPKWFDNNSLIGWVRISDVTSSTKILQFTTQKLSDLGIKNSRYVERGNLIMSICATIGRPILTRIDVCIHDGFVVFRKPTINKEYLYYFLSFIEKDWSKNGQTGSQMNLNTNLIKKTEIYLPPTKTEQTAIANALSDADLYIESLEKLIDKKQKIKQGSLQQLLKPKENWEVKKLGEIANFFKGRGLSKSEIKESGKFKCIHYGELFTKYNHHIINIISYTDKKDDSFHSSINDVLMPTSDVTPNGLATASCITENGVIIGGDVLVIRLNNNVMNGIFLSYFIDKNRDELMKLVSGSTVYHLYGSDVKKLTITYPPIEEQERIVNSLSDMELELNILTQKLTKAKAIKQGMMQQLLTGKIRLI